MPLWLPCAAHTQADSDGSALGPASAASLMTLTDAGLGGRFGRLFPGISTSAGILSSVLTSALFHPVDAAMASFNVNLCGCDKVWQGFARRLAHISLGSPMAAAAAAEISAQLTQCYLQSNGGPSCLRALCHKECLVCVV